MNLNNTNKVGLLFQGQGSQGPEMFDSLQQIPEAQEFLAESRGLLGLDLAESVFSGDADILRSTDVAQPAIVIAELAVLHAAGLEPGIDFQGVAGHSLGEISALVAAEVLTPKQGILMAAERGAFMKEATNDVAGGMTIVRKTPLDTIEGLVDAAKEQHKDDEEWVIDIGNINSPSQVIVSGSIHALKWFEEQANQGVTDPRKAHAVRLDTVGGAFHSGLMSDAQQKFIEYLSKVTFKKTKAQVFPGATAEATEKADILEKYLGAGVAGTVEWVDVVNSMVGSGFSRFKEIGPGKPTLGPFVKATVKAMEDESEVTTELYALTA